MIMVRTVSIFMIGIRMATWIFSLITRRENTAGFFSIPGAGGIRELWGDYYHGKCEDSELEISMMTDWSITLPTEVAYFNRKTQKNRFVDKDESIRPEQRVPTVMDMDGDGLQDLVVGGEPGSSNRR